jgi:hypothetical protein
MLGLSLWIIWPALLLSGLDWWLFRRLDKRSLILAGGWLLLMSIFVLTIR